MKRYTYNQKYASLLLQEARQEFKRHLPLSYIKGMTAMLMCSCGPNPVYLVECNSLELGTIRQEVKAQSASEAKAEVIFDLARNGRASW